MESTRPDGDDLRGDPAVPAASRRGTPVQAVPGPADPGGIPWPAASPAESGSAASALLAGQVDAVVVPGPSGAQVFTRTGSADPFRVLEAMEEGAAILADGLITYCNSQLGAMIGAALVDLIGEPIERFAAPGAAPVLRSLLESASETPRRAEAALIAGDGTAIPVQCTACMLNIDGAAGLCLIVSNISERRSEEQARLVGNYNRSLIEAHPDPLILVDLAGNVVDVNQAAEAVTGRPRIDLIGAPSPLPPDLISGTELDLRHRDGYVTTMLFNEAPYHDADGRPAGALISLRDRGPYKEAEKALRLQSAALDAAANAVVITDRTGTVVWVNRAFTALTGYSAEEIIGRQPRDLVRSGVHGPEFYRAMWDTILRGEVWHGEITNRRRDGTLYLEDMVITPVRGSDGEVGHFIAIKRDLTEEKLLESQLLQSQKMEVVGRLAGGIAHDFNNLLTVINGTAEVAAASLSAADPLCADLHEIHAAGLRAAALTRQLLAFSRKQVQKPEVLSIAGLVTDLRSMLKRVIGEDVELRMDVPSGTRAFVRADRGQLEQVLLNLVVNARDAMPSGGQLTITVAEGPLPADIHPQISPRPAGVCAVLSISDTGTGMDDATRSRIFEPFFTTKEPGRGTGLGLATVHGIVRQSGGTIAVESAPARGSTFRVCLPAVAPEPEMPRPPAPVHAAGGTILIVEDEDGVRHMARRILESGGYRVFTASNGGEALLALERLREDLDLVLTDVVMPFMSGTELAARVEAARPGTMVVFTSGHTDSDALRQTLLDENTPFIPKPYTKQDLLQRVGDALSARG